MIVDVTDCRIYININILLLNQLIDRIVLIADNIMIAVKSKGILLIRIEFVLHQYPEILYISTNRRPVMSLSIKMRLQINTLSFIVVLIEDNIKLL